MRVLGSKNWKESSEDDKITFERVCDSYQEAIDLYEEMKEKKFVTIDERSIIVTFLVLSDVRVKIAGIEIVIRV